MIFEYANDKNISDIYKIQKAGFESLYHRYKDEDSPYNESEQNLLSKLKAMNNYFLLFNHNNKYIGFMRVNTNAAKTQARIAPIVILPEFENFGFGTLAMMMVEKKFDTVKEWKLDTIIQEKKLLNFYLKLGYKESGQFEEIKENMDIVYLSKNL